MTYYLPIILMVLGTTVYHIAQKSVPTQALLGTILLIPFYPSRAAGQWTIRRVNWASCSVGLSIVAVELAVLLAYRTGWKITLVSVIGNTASALLLVGIGLVFFQEHLSARSLGGVALCLAGLALITQH